MHTLSAAVELSIPHVPNTYPYSKGNLKTMWHVYLFDSSCQTAKVICNSMHRQRISILELYNQRLHGVI